MKSSVFSFGDYKEYMRAELTTTWGDLSKAAEAIGCQRSQLSRILKSHVHLTMDQAVELTHFWELMGSEAEYFLQLVEYARAGTSRYRERVQNKILDLKREHENLSQRVQRESLEPGEKEMTYYSAWYWGAIHILVSIPQYQTRERIARRLSLPENLVQDVLETLGKFGLIKKHGAHWVFNSADLHIAKGSLMAATNHSNWRQRAVLDAQLPQRDSLHYSAAQSMSEEAYQAIKEKLLQMIDEVGRVAGPSKEEELVAFTLDFFRV